MDISKLATLRKAAHRKGIISEEGTPNVLAINHLSAVYTSPLLSGIWEKVFPDISIMTNLLETMRSADQAGQYGEFLIMLRTLYTISGEQLPEEIEYIIECEDGAVKEMYAYEFLQDFADLMYDFREEAKEAI